MDFKEVRMPLVLSAYLIGGPTFNTRTFPSQSGDEQHLSLWQYPLYKGELSDAEITVDQHQAVKKFHYTIRGRAYGFRVLDPYDHYVASVAEGQFVATATPNVYQMVKVYSIDGDTWVRPITKPIPTSMTVFNGAAPVTSPALDYTTGLLTLAGTSAAVLTWLGMFDTPCFFTDADWLQIGRNSDGTFLAVKNFGVQEIRVLGASTGTPPALTEFLPTPDFVPYVAPPPTSLTLSPTSLSTNVGVASGTIAATLDHPATAAFTVALSTTGTGGSFSPATLSFAVGDTTKSFTRTPAAAGTETITASGGGLTSNGVTLTATASVLLTSGVAQSFALVAGATYQFYLPTTTASNLHIVTTGMFTPGSYAYGTTQWKRNSVVGSGTPPYDGQMSGSNTADVAIAGAGTEYINVVISTTASGTGTLTVTAS